MVILRGTFDISPEDIITRYKLQDLVHIDVSAYVLGGGAQTDYNYGVLIIDRPSQVGNI